MTKKRMKNHSTQLARIPAFPATLLAICLLLGWALPMAGQDWSAEQKAVWQVIEDSNAAWAAGDLEGVYENTHADFTWWTYVTAAPGNRAAAMSYDGANIGRNKVVATDVQPLTVQVYDTFAVVHYYARSLSENADGERNFQEARVTDVFKKENGRWMLVANHWGDVSALE